MAPEAGERKSLKNLDEWFVTEFRRAFLSRAD
jgi:hypothetical protein